MKLGIVGPESTICGYFLKLIPKEWEIETHVEEQNIIEVSWLSECDIIINFAGYTNVAKSDIFKEKCWRSNVELVKELITVCKSYKIPLLHFSTLYVSSIGFMNEKMQSYWNDGYQSYYTLTKWIAEQLLFLSEFKNWGIIRTDSIFGLNKFKQDNKFVGHMVKALRSCTLPTLADVSGLRPTYAKDVALYLFQILQYFESDMLNFNKDIFQATNSVNSNEIVTLLDYFIKIAEILELPADYLFDSKAKKRFKCNFINSGLRHWEEALKEYIINELST